MKVVLDTSVLVFLINPGAPAPLDPATGECVTHCRERIEGLLEDFDASGVQLVVPTPVLSELLIRSGNRQAEVIAALSDKRSVQVAPFDVAAAVENAALRRSRSSSKSPGETKKDVSFDLQILAIARVAGASKILTDDENLRKRASRAGLQTLGIADIPISDAKRQTHLFARPGMAVDAAATPIEQGPP